MAPVLRGRMDSRDYLHDETRWPLVRVTVPTENPDAAGFERHLAAVDSVLARRQPFAVVVDARAGRGMPAWQRDRLRTHRRAVFFETQRYQRAVAFVVGSAFQRAILGAILWLAPEPCPSRTFASLEEAESWAQSHLGHSAAA
jgi:hypothetical protein